MGSGYSLFDCVHCFSKRQSHQLRNSASCTSGWEGEESHGRGLLITYEKDVCYVGFVADEHCEQIHPNIFIPAGSVCDVVEYGGGGSGTTVLGAEYEMHGKVVIKHANAKDTDEIFSLATIESDLRMRGQQNNCEQAAEELRRRTPDFKFIYISPHHLHDRAATLRWRKLQNTMDVVVRMQGHRLKRRPSDYSNPPTIRISSMVRGTADQEPTARPLNLVDNQLEISPPLVYAQRFPRNGGSPRYAGSPDTQKKSFGYDYLHDIVNELRKLQKEHDWKFSLAQSHVGGGSPTPFSLLVDGALDEALLAKLVDGYVSMILHLKSLTLDDECRMVNDVRHELSILNSLSNPLPSDVSNLADEYVGCAIKKNYDYDTGRFMLLRKMGQDFRENALVLDHRESIPAQLLGTLLKVGAQAEEVFATGLQGQTALDIYFNDGMWKQILTDAVSVDASSATQCIWTCGLIDAGLHNVKLDENGLWFFDLGHPSLMSIPGFLTKVLFSFYHTLGMTDDGNGTWIVRFEIQKDGRLELTPATVALMKSVKHAFNHTVDCFIHDVFDNAKGVRAILEKYVVLQLLSDAGFCLTKWKTKGGGEKKWRAISLEKWLWRAIWNLYAATELTCESRVSESTGFVSSFVSLFTSRQAHPR